MNPTLDSTVRRELEVYGLKIHEEGSEVTRSLPQLLSRAAEIEVAVAKILHFKRSDDTFLSEISKYTQQQTVRDADVGAMLAEAKNQYDSTLNGIRALAEKGVDAVFVLEPDRNTLYFEFDPQIIGRLPDEKIRISKGDKPELKVSQGMFWEAVCIAYILGDAPRIVRSGEKDLWERLVNDYRGQADAIRRHGFERYFGIFSPTIGSLKDGEGAWSYPDASKPGVNFIGDELDNPKILVEFRDRKFEREPSYFSDRKRGEVLETLKLAGVRSIRAKPGENYPHRWDKSILIPYDKSLKA